MAINVSTYYAYNRINIDAYSIGNTFFDVPGATISFMDFYTRAISGNTVGASAVSYDSFRRKSPFVTPTLNTQYSVVQALSVTTYFTHVHLDDQTVPGYADGYNWSTSSLGDESTRYPTAISTQNSLANDNGSNDYMITSFNGTARTIGRFIVPSGCTSITIKAWGGGGGSGGSYSLDNPASGGAGGYATTTLTVGTHIETGNVVHCFPGLAGIGGVTLWQGGTGGGASAVYTTRGSVGYPTAYTQFDWRDSAYTGAQQGFKGLINANSCILIAGGGGGGGATNTSYVYPSNHGGSGGSLNSGSGSISTGTNTGATTTDHSNASVSRSQGSYWGTLGGGRYCPPFETVPVVKNVGQEASMFSSYPSRTNTVAAIPPTDGSTTWATAGSGGGGAFCGAGGEVILADRGAGNYGRGGGGGSNKVYMGSGSTNNSGISSTPYNSAESGGYGYGGTGRGYQHQTNYYAGNAGTSGRILITFNG